MIGKGAGRVDFDLGEEGGRKLRDLKKREGAG